MNRGPSDIFGHQEVLDACQRIGDLVGRVCRVPVTLLMRQNPTSMEVVIASQTGSNPYRPCSTESLGEGLYCEKVISEQRPLLVTNALNDPEWCENPDIELGMIFYYGVPVNWPDGTPFGTFCILDKNERPCGEADRDVVHEFAKVIETLLRQVILQKELTFQASHDSLTGCLNRPAFLSRLNQELDRFHRFKAPFSLFYLDLDRFKAVNDAHGHVVGDQVLQHVATLLEDNTRKLDFVGRIGGEEFAICLPGTDLGGAAEKAERLRKQVMCSPCVVYDQAVSLTVSIGVGQIRPGEPIGALLRRADAALYAAKADGRNAVRVEDPQVTDSLPGPLLERLPRSAKNEKGAAPDTGAFE